MSRAAIPSGLPVFMQLSMPRGHAKLWLSRISLSAVAPIADFAGRFARTVLLSRLLSPAEFGTSVALTIVLAIALMISDIGLDRFVLLRSEEEGPRVLAVGHLIQAIRGLITAFAVLIMARPAAVFFAVPAATPAFLWAALVPLLHACAHLGPKQAHRRYDFRQDALAMLGASAASLLAALPAAWLLHDHNAMLVSLVVAEVVYVGATHAFAGRPYRLAWDKSMSREALAYGLPLMVNGIGLSAFAQADRILVGAFFGIEALGAYAVAVSLAIVTLSPLYAICSSLGVSILARNRFNAERLPPLFMVVAWGFGVFAFSYCAAVGVSLDLLVSAIYGLRYSVEPGVRIALAAIAFVRILRGPASVLLLVEGDTGRLTIANLLGGVGFGLAALFVKAVPSLESILAGILVGDVLCFALLQDLACRRLPQLRVPSRALLATEAGLAIGLLGLLSVTSSAGPGERAMIVVLSASAAVWMAWRTLLIARRDHQPLLLYSDNQHVTEARADNPAANLP